MAAPKSPVRKPTKRTKPTGAMHPHAVSAKGDTTPSAHALQVCRELDGYTNGDVNRWAMTHLIAERLGFDEVQMADAVEFAARQGWLRHQQLHSLILTDEGRQVGRAGRR